MSAVTRLDPGAAHVLAALVDGIAATLGPRLLGLYLYGSAVLGDFDPERSDLDLLAVTDGLLPEERSGLLALHDGFERDHPAWADRIEVGYFPSGVLRDFTTARGDVVRISPGESLHRTPALAHWLVDLYSVQEHGVRLLGDASEDHLPAITAAEFTETIRRMVADWVDLVVGVEEERHQAYVRLLMCRSLYACATGEQASKVRAAAWVADRYPQWREATKEAVHWRRTDSPAVNIDAAERTVELVQFTFGATRQSGHHVP